MKKIIKRLLRLCLVDEITVNWFELLGLAIMGFSLATYVYTLVESSPLTALDLVGVGLIGSSIFIMGNIVLNQNVIQKYLRNILK